MTTPLVPAPTLDALAADPTRAATLPPEEVLALLARCASLQSILLAQMILAARGTDGAGAPASAPTAPTAARWLKPTEVAGILGLPPGRVFELCRTGTLPSTKVGKYRRIPEDGLRAWQAAQGLDKAGVQRIPSSHDAAGRPPRAQGPRTLAVEVRRSARRDGVDREAVGVRGPGRPAADRAAHPAAGDPAPGGAA